MVRSLIALGKLQRHTDIQEEAKTSYQQAVDLLIAIPDQDGNEGTGPLAFLKGINIIIFALALIVAIVSGYIVYKYISDKNKFEALMRTDSQAIFRRNQIEIERLALRLTSKEEKRVLETMKRYRIK